MKIILTTFFILLFFISSLWSQQFTAIDNEWQTTLQDFTGISKTVIRPAGTTLINDTLYMTYEFINFEDSTEVRVDQLIRETTDGKIWQRQSDGTEYLLYDFGTSIGDTLFTAESFTCPYIVRTIDSIQLNTGEQRKRIGLGLAEIGDSTNIDVYWIAGIGNASISPFVSIGYECVAGPFPRLTCYFSAGNFAYPESDAACFTTSVVEPAISRHLNIYPNPATKMLSIDASDLSLTFSHYSIFTLTGKLIQTGKINMSTPNIEVQALNKGLYFLNLQTTNQHFLVKKFVKN